MDHLAPPAGVRAPGQPALPVIDRLGKELARLLAREGQPTPLPTLDRLKDEYGFLPFGQDEIAGHGRIFLVKLSLGSNSQTLCRRMEAGSMRCNDDFVRFSSIVKSGLTMNLHRYFATESRDDPNQ